MTSSIGVALLTVGSVCLVVGAIAWRLPVPKPVGVIAGVSAALPENNAFGSGLMLFATVPNHRNPPLPKVFGCQVLKAGEGQIEALALRLPELVGSRIVDGAALTV